MRHPPVLVLDLRYAGPHSIGSIPDFLDLDDPRPAKEQFADRYAFGGGWRNRTGLTAFKGTPVLKFPGDPPLKPIAMMALRDEAIFIYLGDYVSIFQPDGTFEACRMD